MELEVSECSGATRMDDSLGNALMIETMNLLSCNLVLKHHRTGVVVIHLLQPVVRIADTHTMVGGQWLLAGLYIMGVGC